MFIARKSQFEKAVSQTFFNISPDCLLTQSLKITIRLINFPTQENESESPTIVHQGPVSTQLTHRDTNKKSVNNDYIGSLAGESLLILPIKM